MGNRPSDAPQTSQLEVRNQSFRQVWANPRKKLQKLHFLPQRPSLRGQMTLHDLAICLLGMSLVEGEKQSAKDPASHATGRLDLVPAVFGAIDAAGGGGPFARGDHCAHRKTVELPASQLRIRADAHPGTERDALLLIQ